MSSPVPRICCGVCERVINVASDQRAVFLCRECAAVPVLVAAFIEGRARLAGEGER
jgi:hypothetical protein